MKEGWEIKKLGEVCEISNGSTPLRSRKEFWENGNINWFTINDIRNQGRTINHTNQKITIEGFNNSSLRILPRRTVLLCCTASVGEYAITNIELTTNQQFNGLIVKDFDYLLPEYLFHFSSTLKEQLLKASGKTTIDFVSMTKVKKVQIPIPPLSEQKQIVAILDKAFAAIDQAQANIEKNIENAKELFQSKLNDIFSQKGDGWEEKSLGEVVKIIGGGTPSKKVKDYYNGNIPWATVRDMNCDELSETDLTITEEGLKNSSSNIIPEGEIIVATRVGLGKVCLLNQAIAINQDLKGLIPINNDLNREFLFFWYKSIAEQVEKDGVGMTVKGVNLNYVKALKIHFPSIEIQKNVVSVCKDLKERTEAIESHYQQKLANLEELKKFILQKAFSGELTNEATVSKYATVQKAL